MSHKVSSYKVYWSLFVNASLCSIFHSYTLLTHPTYRGQRQNRTVIRGRDFSVKLS